MMNKKLYINQDPIENTNFNFRDLNTIQNHWIKIKGDYENGIKSGVCKVFMINGDILFCKF